MKLSVRKEPMLEIGTVGEKRSYSSMVWVLCLATLMVLGNVLAFVKMWGTLSPGIVKVAAVAFFTMILTAAIEYRNRETRSVGVIFFNRGPGKHLHWNENLGKSPGRSVESDARRRSRSLSDTDI